MTYKALGVKRICKIREHLAAFSTFSSLGTEKTGSRMLKLVGDCSLIWKTKGHSLVESSSFSDFQINSVFSSLLVMALLETTVHLYFSARLLRSWNPFSISRLGCISCVAFAGMSVWCSFDPVKTAAGTFHFIASCGYLPCLWSVSLGLTLSICSLFWRFQPYIPASQVCVIFSEPLHMLY